MFVFYLGHILTSDLGLAVHIPVSQSVHRRAETSGYNGVSYRIFQLWNLHN